MTTIQIVFLLFVIFLGQFIFVWVSCLNKLIGLPDGLVHISSDYDVDWVFTNFLTPHALAYEKLRHKINNKGMVILFVLITLTTFPCSLLCAVIGLDILAVKSIWQWFCETFKREPDFKEGEKQIRAVQRRIQRDTRRAYENRNRGTE